MSSPSISLRRWQNALSRRGDPARRALDLSRGKAARADLHFDGLAICVEHARDLEIRLPCATRRIVCVRPVVAERDALFARVTTASIDRHRSALDQFDTRHIGAVTLAVTHLQDAGVPAISRRVLRTDLLKELIGSGALLDVADG